MDYDATAMPDAYDVSREHGPAVSDLWMRKVAECVAGRNVSKIVDLGCGTGRFSQQLASHFDASVVGIDPSRRMLAHARAKRSLDAVSYCAGVGEALPLPDRSADVIFSSMAIHHFDSPERVARECKRVLRESGIVFLRIGTRESTADNPGVPFFPRSGPLLAEMLPERAGVSATFEAAGFERSSAGTLEQQIASTYAEYANKLAAGGDSILAQLTEAELAAGLEALRRHAREVDPRAVLENVDFFCFASPSPG